MLWVVLASCALCFVLIPFFGRLSDKYGRKPIIYAGVAAEAALAFPMFWLWTPSPSPAASRATSP